MYTIWMITNFNSVFKVDFPVRWFLDLSGKLYIYREFSHIIMKYLMVIQKSIVG